MLMNNKTELKAVKLKPASRTKEDVCRDIENLDLEMIKFKLTDPRDFFQWKKEFAEEIEVEYKRFLILKTKYPEQDIAPGLAVDTFWHQHILDTYKYADDCRRIFGSFVHHYPYSGMMGKEDEKQAKETRKVTHSIYEREFGEKPWEVRQGLVKLQRTETKARVKSAQKKK